MPTDSWLEAVMAECALSDVDGLDTQVADAFREPSDDESGVPDSFNRSWFWRDALLEHMNTPIKQSGKVTLLSSCTGSEGEVLQVRVSQSIVVSETPQQFVNGRHS